MRGYTPTNARQTHSSLSHARAAGTSVTLLPPARCWVQQFPPILLEPYTAPAAAASASVSAQDGLTVVISSAGAADYELLVQPSSGCSVGVLKRMLQQLGVEWAAEGSRCVTDAGKVLKDDAAAPAAGKVKLRRT